MTLGLYRTSLIVLVLLTPSLTWAAESCIIEKGPIPELVEYTRSVDRELAALSQEARKTAKCGITPTGASASADRVINVMERALDQIPMEKDIVASVSLDFAYNFSLVIDGEARGPVIQHGVIFQNMDKKIKDSLDALVRSCGLTDPVEKGYIQLIQQNQILDNTYKLTAISKVTPASGLSEANQKVAEAIQNAYNQDATKLCKGMNGSQEINWDTLMNASTNMFTVNAETLKEWDTIKALWYGGGYGMTPGQYVARQRQLLQTELARQGYSPRLTETILARFDCNKRESNGSESFEALAKASSSCFQPVLPKIEKMLEPFRLLVDRSSTTNDRVENVNKLAQRKNNMVDMAKINNTLRTTISPEADIKDRLVLELIDTHIALVTVNAAIERRLRPMYDNCMKAQPMIPCPR